MGLVVSSFSHVKEVFFVEATQAFFVTPFEAPAGYGGVLRAMSVGEEMDGV